MKITGKLKLCIGTIPGRIPSVPGVNFWPAVVNDGDRRLRVGELDSTDAPGKLFVTFIGTKRKKVMDFKKCTDLTAYEPFLLGLC